MMWTASRNGSWVTSLLMFLANIPLGGLSMSLLTEPLLSREALRCGFEHFLSALHPSYLSA